MKETWFVLKMPGSDTMLKHLLSQKLKLIGMGTFNYLINTLIAPTWMRITNFLIIMLVSTTEVD